MVGIILPIPGIYLYLKWAFDNLHPKLAKASSFGAEDAAIIDMMFKINSDSRLFTLETGRLPKETFDAMWKEAGINGLNGHRSVGGYRASMYNALSLDSVKVLVEVMSDLESKA